MADLRAIVQRHYANVSEGRPEKDRELFDPSVVTTDPGAGQMRGIEAFLGYEAAFAKAFPDGRLEGTRFVEQGDTVMVEGTFSGTHSGPLVGAQGTVPPTGKRVALPFADVFRIANGKIVEHRIYYDQMAFLGQLGLLPAPAAA
jgi:predicted ester cyclase